MQLSAVLAPVPVSTFLSVFCGQRPTHIPGAPEKFRSLFSWADLSAVLREHRFTGPRLRLAKRGKDLPHHQYLLEPGNAVGSLVSEDLLMNCLRQGATLALNKVDEVLSPVRALAESCERILRVDVAVNLYAAWGSEHGFKLHWDDHDTLILQVAGAKRWRVYEPTRASPTAADPVVPVAPAADAPHWDLLLREGAFLYIPRGWWHIAIPQNGLSMHLTVGPRPPIGVDFIRWLSEQLLAREEYRRDVPLWTTHDSLQRHLENLVAGLTENLGDLADRYLDAMDERARRRPSLEIGPTLDAHTAPVAADSRFQLRTVRPPRVVRVENGCAELSFDGMHVVLPRELATQLASEEFSNAVTIQSLLTTIPSSRHDDVLAALDVLRSAGKATIVAGAPTTSEVATTRC